MLSSPAAVASLHIHCMLCPCICLFSRRGACWDQIAWIAHGSHIGFFFVTAPEFFSGRSLCGLGLMDRWPSLEQTFLQGRIRKVPVCQCLYTERKLPVLGTCIWVLSYIWSMYNACKQLAWWALYIGVVGTALPHAGCQWFCHRGVLGSDLLLPLKQAGWSASLFTVSVTVLLVGNGFCVLYQRGNQALVLYLWDIFSH